MRTTFKYPSGVIANSVGPAAIAVFAPLIPVLVVLIVEILAIGRINFDLARVPIGLLTAVGIGWVTMIVACVPRAYVYLQQYSFTASGLRRSFLGRSDIIRWEDVALIERRTVRAYTRRGWVDEISLAIQSKAKRFAVYEQLDGFEEFKMIIAREGRSRAVPFIAVDKTLATLADLKKRDLELYRKSRRGGLRSPIADL